MRSLLTLLFLLLGVAWIIPQAHQWIRSQGGLSAHLPEGLAQVLAESRQEGSSAPSAAALGVEIRVVNLGKDPLEPVLFEAGTERLTLPTVAPGRTEQGHLTKRSVRQARFALQRKGQPVEIVEAASFPQGQECGVIALYVFPDRAEVRHSPGRCHAGRESEAGVEDIG